MGPAKRITRTLAATVGAAVLVPAAASAATVAVETSSESNTMKFSAEPGETNTVTLGVVQLGDPNSYSVTDATAPLVAGEGCTGGGPAGSTATCTVPASRMFCPVRGCLPGITTAMDIDLGDGDDSLDSTALPVRDGGTGPFQITERGGPGADVLTDGEAIGFFYPGVGSDRVSTGTSFAIVYAGAETPDGADVYDLGQGQGGQLDYSAAGYDLRLSLDGVANDGGPGENDQIVNADYVVGGSGDDTITDPESQAGELAGLAGDDELTGGTLGDVLYGGDGDDRLRGKGGNDELYGDYARTGEADNPGDDDLRGGAGNDDLDGDQGSDRLGGGSGADRLAGTSGGFRDGDPDRLDCGSGRDRRAFAGAEDTVRRCERVKEL